MFGRRGLRASLVVILVVVFTTGGWGGVSHAQVTLAFELDAGIPVAETADELKPGVGIQLRAGYNLPLPMIFVVEAIFDYCTFNYPDTDEAFVDNLRVGAGIRIGPDIVFVPVVFAHAGYGTSALIFNRNNIEASGGGFTWDAGIAWDFLRTSRFSLGIQAAYKSTLLSDVNFTYIAAGLHGELHF